MDGPRELIKDGYNGFLVPTNNEGELGNKIVEVLLNKENLEIVSKFSKESMQEFTTDKNEKSWRDFILKNKRNR